MGRWNVEFAKLLKERENILPLGNLVGRVVEVKPIRISVLNGDVILQKQHLYITDLALSRALKVGDEVVLIPTSSEQKFFIIDKVKKVSDLNI